MDLLDDPILRFLGESVVIKTECDSCHNIYTIEVNSIDLMLYDKGDLVQNVWPSLDTWDREVIIGARTGYFICKTCTNLLDDEED